MAWQADHRNLRRKNSPFLDRPLLPLAVALPPMLEQIGVELRTAGPAEP
jgi:hypothetical protein